MNFLLLLKDDYAGLKQYLETEMRLQIKTLKLIWAMEGILTAFYVLLARPYFKSCNTSSNLSY